MTDWERAISTRLPEVWTPRVCTICEPHEHVYLTQHLGFSGSHDIPCPPPSRDLGFRLLEAMLRDCTLALVGWLEGKFYFHESPASPASEDPDLLTVIIKAADALAEKKQP